VNTIVVPANPLDRYNIKSILIVDDDPMNQMALQVVIQSAMGITNQEHFKNLVKFADNGQKAVDHCKVSVPDLIFMDINMPVMNGYEASK